MRRDDPREFGSAPGGGDADQIEQAAARLMRDGGRQVAVGATGGER